MTKRFKPPPKEKIKFPKIKIPRPLDSWLIRRKMKRMPSSGKK